MGLSCFASVGVVCSPSCKSMAPMPNPDASTCKKNFFLKFSWDSTGAVHILVFNSSNAHLCLASQVHRVAFFVRSNKGQAIFE